MQNQFFVSWLRQKVGWSANQAPLFVRERGPLDMTWFKMMNQRNINTADGLLTLGE